MDGVASPATTRLKCGLNSSFTGQDTLKITYQLIYYRRRGRKEGKIRAKQSKEKKTPIPNTRRTMTDQLLDQVRDLAEGQIVSTQSIISYAIIFARGQSQPIHTVHKRCKADSLILIRVPTCRTLKDRDWLNSSQTALLAISGAIAFFVGFFKQDIKLALAFGLLGTAFTFAVVVPPWPFYKRHPVRWLPVGGRDVSSQEIIVDGKTVG
ncbi:hypothetical protein EYC84_003649 [Monilinia fructicola]|uniref:Signal peptidase complex subunit 1 n=1 Tax=Monilinia fructicola TaxID=38448 RepID=A0A5M9JXC5_MONFR|nr:hypothetical protein EYC84_003649 [Monilinia fructicola]